MCIEEDLIDRECTMKKNKNEMKDKCAVIIDEAQTPILFDGAMRKTFAKGVFQDMKGYFEMRSGGAVAVTYEDFMLKNHEFGFKMSLLKNEKCSKQMFNEVSGALINAVNYMFPADSDNYDVSFSTSHDKVEVEFVSNW